MTQLSGQRARFAAEARVVFVIAEPGLHDQGALGQERVVRAAGRDVDTFNANRVLLERVRVFVPGKAPVCSGVCWQRSEHVQRVVIFDVDPVGWLHDPPVLVPIHRGSRITIGVAAQCNVTVRCELIAVREFNLDRNGHWVGPVYRWGRRWRLVNWRSWSWISARRWSRSVRGRWSRSTVDDVA